MARYRVIAHDTRVDAVVIEVEAPNAEEAQAVAEEADGREWSPLRNALFTDWTISSVEEIKP